MIFGLLQVRAAAVFFLDETSTLCDIVIPACWVLILSTLRGLVLSFLYHVSASLLSVRRPDPVSVYVGAWRHSSPPFLMHFHLIILPKWCNTFAAVPQCPSGVSGSSNKKCLLPKAELGYLSPGFPEFHHFQRFESYFTSVELILSC